jgi:NAD(P)-dependent dehydrogenase (short-subunit alcohol dehydrogenase family)
MFKSASDWSPDEIPDQRGRTALITGANSGIGLETARVLARHGTRVILAGRNDAKLKEAAATIRAELPSAELETLVLDLSDLGSITAAARRIAETETIDLLINNAGVMNIPERTTTIDGLETTFATNHLGPFALTLQVLPALRRAPSARIVTVSAIAARWRSAHSRDILSQQRYRGMAAYARSKRANVVFTRELNRRLAGTDIRAFVVHPGSAMTDLQRHTTGVGARLFGGVSRRLLMGSPEGAAWPTLYAATSDNPDPAEFIGPAGRKQDSGTPRPVRQPRGANDPAEGKWLWEQSERLTGVTADNLGTPNNASK